MGSTHGESGTLLRGQLRVTRGRSPFLFGACLLLGLVVLVAGVLRPLWRLYAAQGWTALPCRIVSSGFIADASQRYTEQVVYSYEIAGNTHQANRYQFVQLWSRDQQARARKEAELIARYPSGSQTTCYVNPRDPTEAVLERRADPMFLLALGSGSLLVTGLGIWGLRKRTRGRQQA